MVAIRELTGQQYRNVYAGKTVESDAENLDPARVATVGV